MEEEFIYPSDEELAASFVDDLFNAFMYEVKKYPVLSIEELKDLARKYKKGDESAKEKLVNHNLRLVVHVASAYKNKLKHLSVMDIIQEGVIGLMTAIEKYDPDVGAFSTYAITWIRQAITRSINDTNEEIRKPVHFIYKLSKYRRIVSKAIKESKAIPDDKELKKILECTDEMLQLIKKKDVERVVSAQTKVGDDEESDLEDFIADETAIYDDLLNNVSDHELLVVLKYKLRPIEYYLICKYELSKSDDVTLESIAQVFNITRERVRQLKKAALNKAKPYIVDTKLRHKVALEIENEKGKKIADLRKKPLIPEDIVTYSHMKDKLDDKKLKILKEMLFGETVLSNKDTNDMYDMPLVEYKKITEKLRQKINTISQTAEYEAYKEEMKLSYGTNIFLLVPNEMPSEIVKNEPNKGVKKAKMDAEITEEGELVDETAQKVKTNAILDKEPEIEEKKEIWELIDINDKKKMIILKNRLSLLNYYVFYYLLLGKKEFDKTEAQLSEKLNTPLNKIQMIKRKLEKSIEKYLNDPDFFAKEGERLENKYHASLGELNEKPIEVDGILILAFVQSHLTDEEYEVLYDIVYGLNKSNIKYLLDRLHMTEEEYYVCLDNVKQVAFTLINNNDKFDKYKKDMIVTYGTRVFDKNFHREVKEIDFNRIKEKYDGLSIDEIKNIYGEKWTELDINSQNLLRRYFTVPDNTFTSKESWENNFFLELGNIRERDIHLSPKILYQTYLNNKDAFSKQNQLFLECYVFETKDKGEYLDNYGSYPNNIARKSLLLDKLEKIYFNIHRIFNGFNFNREQWIKVLEKHENKFSEMRILALNMFYGVETEAMSIPEIAEVFAVDRQTMHDFIAKARKTAIALYMNHSSLRELDVDKYMPYILNKAYTFTDTNREILKMVVIEGMSYAEVKEVLSQKEINLSQYKISNIVTESLRKIDFYRYGITEPHVRNFSENLIKKNKKDKKDIFTDRDNLIIKLKYIDHLKNDEIAKIVGMDKEKLSKQIRRFNRILRTFRANNVELSEEDYIKEFNAPIVERILSDEQMKMLSISMGIKCRYNPTGEKYSVPEMVSKFPEYQNEDLLNLYRKIKRANDLLKLKKKKLYHNDLIFMPTAKIDKVLNDPHIPITDKERFIICSIYGIKGVPRKTLKELAEMYGNTEDSVKRRYQRAFLSIYKYLNGEIEAKIDFDYDIAPIMRFFSIYDRKLIEDSYKNGLSYEKIAKKYKMTFDQTVTRFNRLNFALFEMINNPKDDYFDFDFYQKAIEDPLFPFYGNLEEAVKMFDMHFANSSVKNYACTEIVKELNLNRGEKSVNKTIYNLLLAVCRYKKGIRKSHTYTHEDVVNYYESHKDSMKSHEEIKYLKYFKRRLIDDANRHRELINKSILIDLVKDEYPDLVDIDMDKSSTIIELIKNPKYKFSSRVKNALLNMIGETERITMNGQELNHVYRLLNRLDKSRVLNEDNKELILAN